MATPVGNANPVTGDPILDGLLQGGEWDFGTDPRVLTYAFEVETELPSGPIAWTDGLKTLVQQALAEWAAVADLSFQEIAPTTDIDSSGADLALALMGNFLGTQLGATALGFFPHPAAVDEILVDLFGDASGSPNAEGDIYFDNAQSPFAFTGAGGAAREVVLHEIGHALGLKHPEDVSFDGHPATSFDTRFTIMAKSPIGFPLSAGHAATPLLYDILTIQAMYGANETYRAGDDTYFLELDNAQRAIWDAGGIDTLDASHLPFAMAFSLQDGVVLDLDIRTQFAIAFNVTIENAYGTAFADSITGNAADNLLEGGAGSDTLAGGAGGIDTLAGGEGNDIYVTDAGDVVLEEVNAGVDTIESPVSTVLVGGVENLKLTGAAPTSGMGNALANVLTGNSADNTLDGGAGADTLVGGAGNDTYMLGADDVIIDSSGTDTVLSTMSLSGVAAAVENVTLVSRAGNASIGGSAAPNRFSGNNGTNLLDGGLGNDTLEGGRGDDTLVGGAGNDRLDGGRGADLMRGDAGNDTYVVSSSRDRILEAAGGGVDTVEVQAARYVLDANVENAVLLRDGGSIVEGNALANRFVFTALGPVHSIVGFKSGLDRIVLDGAPFTDASDVTYEASIGALLYDGVQFALLVEHPAFTAADLQIV